MCESGRNIGHCGCIVWKRRCICWYEPVRIRCRHRRNERRPEPERRCHCHFEGISLQLTTIEDKELPADEPVVFDEILTNNSRFISYDDETGVIEIFKHGHYLIDWDIVIKGSSKERCVRFGIEVNGEVVASATLPVAVGQLSGHAFIQIDQTPTTIRLINDSGETVKLSKFTPIANLRIVSIE